MGRQDKFRFRRLDNIGAAAAEEDINFLRDCFLDTGSIETLLDCRDPRSVVIGRTGSGKTALLSRLSEVEERVIEIRPESLALSYISNSTILNFFDRLGVKLDIFFRLLWRHVFTVELIKHHFKIRKDFDKRSLFEKISSHFVDNKGKEALQYLETWGKEFWEETEYRIKEVTTKLEKDLRGAIETEFPGANFTVSASNKLSSAEKAAIIHRAQHVVNTVQIRQLSDIIDVVDKVLDDPQKRYFLVIDSLDEDWIEDRLRYRLIRALIETVKDFHKIRHAKIVVALRLDLIERVFKLTRDSEFQEEKYQSLYLPVKWTDRDLITMLDSRIDYLIRQRFTKQRVTHKDLLPSKIDGMPPATYILQRSMMRPRDIIMFFNECIEQAADRRKISLAAFREAEGTYSRNRLISLTDEWAADYPNLKHFTPILRSRKSIFLATEMTRQDIETICLKFCIDHPNSEKDDILSIAAKELINVPADHDYFRKAVLQVFHRTGLIGIKLETFETVRWATLGSSVSKLEISDGSKISIHPMFWRVFGVRGVGFSRKNTI